MTQAKIPIKANEFRKGVVRGQDFTTNNSHSINTARSRNSLNEVTATCLSTEYTGNTSATQNVTNKAVILLVSFLVSMTLYMTVKNSWKFEGVNE